MIAALTQAGGEMAQGWMRLFAPATAAPGAGAGSIAGGAWLEQLRQLAATLPDVQRTHLEQQARLWSAMLAGGASTPAPDVAPPVPGDRRFSAKAWRDNPYYDYLRQSYLLSARFVTELVERADVDATTRARLEFGVKQWLDALSPANFSATNPEVLTKALETRGESLTQGLANMMGDAQKGRISQTDESAFEVGRNLAVSPGSVVYENALIQLIQYTPTTKQVATRPLVMVPPCINKYYILDLQPENSFVRHAVDAGHTVFMVSWRNPGEESAALGWDDYLETGVFTALRVAREIARSDRVNALGFCVGGTLLGAGLAVLAARGEDIVASATWLTTMLDFSEPGQIGLFVDPASVAAREAMIGEGGTLPANDLSIVFSSLRANDLIWPYVVNNYLLGRSPAAFDLLYWNSDGTNLPGPMYCWYLRNTYLENRLCVPGALTNCGVPVDLGEVKVPSFILATREDHIVPWRAAYRTVHLLGGENTFVLGASGHVAGVVNPAAKNKRSYWRNDAPLERAEDWLAGAAEHPGSWWTAWRDWLAPHGGKPRKARLRPGNQKYKVIEPAPGRYVRERAPVVRAPDPSAALLRSVAASSRPHAESP
ncbi:MAG: class I poly(R)-hydroxyalkanoic acid synthase [Proteobacteria bacterium]|nr:class I poly(R)-hydroxyalkanoic acid synthase [Pseudomonadota bacterium]